MGDGKINVDISLYNVARTSGMLSVIHAKPGRPDFALFPRQHCGESDVIQYGQGGSISDVIRHFLVPAESPPGCGNGYITYTIPSMRSRLVRATPLQTPPCSSPNHSHSPSWPGLQQPERAS